MTRTIDPQNVPGALMANYGDRRTGADRRGSLMPIPDGLRPVYGVDRRTADRRGEVPARRVARGIGAKSNVRRIGRVERWVIGTLAATLIPLSTYAAATLAAVI